jgi:hypothetical protein
MRMTEMKMKTPGINTMSITGVSLLWGVMLGLIHPGWSVLAAAVIMAGWGSETRKVYEPIGLKEQDRS